MANGTKSLSFGLTAAAAAGDPKTQDGGVPAALRKDTLTRFTDAVAPKFRAAA